MEGHEHGAATLPRRHARLEGDAAARARHVDAPAVFDPQLPGVVRVDTHEGFRLDGVERARAAAHRSRVPVLEQSARVEHHRVLVARKLARGGPLGGYELRLARRRGKPVAKEYDGAVLVLRIGVGPELPGGSEISVVERLVGARESGELVEDGLGRVVAHGVAHARRDLADDLPIRPGLAGSLENRTPDLYAAIRVGVAAELLQVRAGRQDDVGELGRFGEEDVLDDQEVEVGERLADLVDVGIGEKRILAHDVHALDVTRESSPGDLDHGEALGWRQLALPGGLEASADLGILDGLVVGEHHRDQARVARALHVVLAAQRVQARAGLSDVAGEQRQGDQAARVVGPVDVLRDPHAPEDDGRLRAAEVARHGADRVGIDAADLGGLLRGVAAHQLAQRLVVLGVPIDIVAIDQVLLDDGVHQRVVEGHVGTGLDAAVVAGVVRQVAPARIDDDQLEAVLARLLEEARCDRVIGGRVRARHQGRLGVLDIAVGRGDGAAPDALEQGGNARRVTQARAVVDVVRPPGRADQLLEQVGLFVGALGAAEARHAVGAVLIADGGQLARHQVEGLVPAGLAEGGQDLRVVHYAARATPPVVLAPDVLRQRALGIAVLASDQRDAQALSVLRIVPAVATLHAEPLLAGRTLAPLGEDDLVGLAIDVIGERAADAAVGTHTIDCLELGARAQG